MRQGVCERAGFGVRQLTEQVSEPFAQQELRGVDYAASLLGQCQCLPAAVGRHRRALDQPGFAKPGQHLGDGRPGNTGPAGKLGGRHCLLADRAQGKIPGYCQRRLMPGEQSFRPPCGKQSDDSQRVSGGGDRVPRLRPRWPRWHG